MNYDVLVKQPTNEFLCLGDDRTLKLDEEVQCICWGSEGNNAMKPTILIKCGNCKKMQHRECVSKEKNADLIQPYICPQC